MDKEKIKSIFYSQEKQSKDKLQKAMAKRDEEYYTPYNTVEFIFKKIMIKLQIKSFTVIVIMKIVIL